MKSSFDHARIPAPKHSDGAYDPYQGWSDEMRLSEFAQTGDPVYLTPAIALSIELPLDLLQNVPGVTEEDIERATELHKPEIDYVGVEEMGSPLSPELELKEQITQLLVPAGIRHIDIEDDFWEEQRDKARRKLLEIVLTKENSVYALMDCLTFNHSKGVSDLSVVEWLRKTIHEVFVQYQHTPGLPEIDKARAHNCAQVLNEFVAVSSGVLQAEAIRTDANYLFSERLRAFAYTVGDLDSTPDLDSHVPFEIQKGVRATFSEDFERVYIADQELSQEIDYILHGYEDDVVWEEVGNYFARHRSVSVPEEITDARYQIIDAGVLLDDWCAERGIFDRALIDDYVQMLRSPIRSVVESDFNTHLRDLTILEQFYFLNYLKKATVESVDQVKEFVSEYGIDGMRTFLALGRGDETLGDGIVAFGRHTQVAGIVFKYYGELLDSAERADQLVRDVSHCDGAQCIELAHQVRENILNRAQRDLEKAVRADDPRDVVTQVENYVASAKEYVALLQEVGTGKIDATTPETLTEGDKTRMHNLLQANYRVAYPKPESESFRADVAGSLLKSFKNPDTIFRILRDQGKIVSFNRFDTLRDYTGKEVSYFGSFNADPAYNGVGKIMLEETIRHQLENGRPMMAHCDPAQAITKKYIEDGFVATAFYPLSGIPSFEIWRSQDSSTQLTSKGKPFEELLNIGTVGETIKVREQSQSESYPELQNGMGLTRYFIHQGKTYLVFETLPEILRSDFTPPQEEQKKAA